MTPVPGIVGEHTLQSSCGIGCAVGDYHHAGVLRKPHPDTATMMKRYPTGAGDSVKEAVEKRPIGDGIGGIGHRFGFAERRCD